MMRSVDRFARRAAAVFLSFASIATPRAAWSQGALSGAVRSVASAAPIEHASLVLDGKENTQSQADGRYRFERVDRGRHVVSVHIVGYRERVDTILVDSSAETRHDFQLERIANLDSVVSTAPERKYISAGLQGFEERRAQGFGHFITDSILRLEDGQSLASILKGHMTGLRIIPWQGDDYVVTTHAVINHSVISGRGRAEAATTFTATDGRRYPDECYVTVFVDGTLRYDKKMSQLEPPLSLGSLFVSELGGVEYYAGSATVPMQFQSKSGCGSLVIWTRER